MLYQIELRPWAPGLPASWRDVRRPQYRVAPLARQRKHRPDLRRSVPSPPLPRTAEPPSRPAGDFSARYMSTAAPALSFGPKTCRSGPGSRGTRMNEQRTARPAGAGARRRSPLFTRQPEPEPTVLSPAEEVVANALTNVVDERVEEGLQALEEQATILMREVATELWRSSAKDVRPEQERIVSLLSTGSGDPQPHRLERRALPGALHPRRPRRGCARRPRRDRARDPGGDGVLRRLDP